MTFHKIALIGRPNVGKSSLFNRLLKKRVAIVNEMEGVTRDRLYAQAEFENKPYILIDTAGIAITDKSDFNQEILEQSKVAILEADYCILVVDGMVGVTKMDQEVVKLIHHYKKPAVLAVNKIDNENRTSNISEFYSLGIDKIEGVSAAHGINIYELLEKIFEDIDLIDAKEEVKDKKPTLSVVGRPNVGKSTFINYLLEQKRCVVSPVAGTTRDAIDIELKLDNKNYTIIDTAGIRRKQKEKVVVEKFASIRTFEAIERSDISLFIISALDGLTSQEKKMLSEIYKLGKSCIIIINKWDLAPGFRMEHAKQALLKDCPFIDIYPIIFISAKTGKNVPALYPLIEKVHQNRIQKIETSPLNRFIEKALHKTAPPMIRGKRLKVYYMTQIKSSPPSFLFFVNNSKLLALTYKRYLMNQIRQEFDLLGSPVNFFLKSKKDTPKTKEKLKLAED